MIVRIPFKFVVVALIAAVGCGGERIAPNAQPGGPTISNTDGGSHSDGGLIKIDGGATDGGGTEDAGPPPEIDGGTVAMPATGGIGAACTSDSNCGEGPQPGCLPAAQDWQGGYCTSACNRDQDCGDNNICELGAFQDNRGNAVPYCLHTCVSNHDCRTGYNCLSYQGQNFCFLKCQNSLDCIDTSETCDQSTGLCTSEVLASPGTDAGPSGTPDAGMNTPDAGSQTGYPAPFPTPPQVPSSGGPTLAHPDIVPIFFSNDDRTTPTSVVDFLKKLAGSSYWSTLSEYGVGSMTVENAITVGSASSNLSDAQIQSWLANEIANGTLPSPRTGTLYVLHYPSSTYITLDNGPGSCESGGFGGYHSEGQTSNRTSFAYAVLPRCAGDQSLNTLDTLTLAESHELVEAATDPYVNSEPAYESVDDSFLYMETLFGGSEVGDMCERDPQIDIRPSDIGYTVQRIWSNQRAAAGHDPCGPEPTGEIYFNAAPVLPSTALFRGYYSSSTTAKCVNNGTLEVDLYSERSTGPWTVRVTDANTYFGSGQATVSVTPSSATGQNGDKLTFSVRGYGGTGLDFFVVSSKNSAGEEHFSIGMVCQ